MLVEQEIWTRLVGAGMGPRSAWALRAAADAAGTDGIGGVLTIRIPPKTKDYVDLAFTCGTVEVVHRW